MLLKIVRFFLLVLPFCALLSENALGAESYSTVVGGVIDENLYKKRSLAYYIKGYDNFNFYSSEEEIRQQIVANGFAKEDEIREQIGEIYTYPDYDSGFTFFDSSSSKFIDFSLATMPMKDFLRTLRSSPHSETLGRIGHLSAKSALDFKVLSWDNKENDDWSMKFYFYRRVLNDRAVYRLFAVTIKLEAGEEFNDVKVVDRAYVDSALKKVGKKYGNFDYRIVKNIGKDLQKHYYTYERRLKSGQTISKIREKKFEHDPNAQIVTQLTVSYLQKNRSYGNLRVMYLATGFLREVMPRLTTSLVDYDNFAQDDSIIDF